MAVMRETATTMQDMEKEIDLQKLLLIYLEKWWLILLCGVICAGAAFLYTRYQITPLYEASVTIYVNNSKGGQQIDEVTGSNLSASQKLVNTYINIIRSNTVLEKVIISANLEKTPEELRAMMTASQMGETELFKIYITHPDPKEAAHIANAVADVAPSEIENFVEGSSTKIIDKAKVPENPSSPSYSRNTMLGGVLGCVLAAAYVTLRHLMDVRVKDEEDLAHMFDYPVLGQIPSFDQKNGGKKLSAYEQPSVAASGKKEGR